MRKLSVITSNIAPLRSGQRPYARRPLNSYVGRNTCVMLFRHQETATHILLSANDDVLCAVWLPKALLSIDRTDRGRFLVVTVAQRTVDMNRLGTCLIDRSRYLPEERVLLEEAITMASRARRRLNGENGNRPTWSGGRNVYA